LGIEYPGCEQLLYNTWNFSMANVQEGEPCPMFAKLIYFFVLANMVYGGWIFRQGMNPDLEMTFMVSHLMLALVFYVWGRYLFRKRAIHE